MTEGFPWPPLADVFAVLTLNAGYNAASVVAGTTLLGIAAGVVGTFALLRKRALMSDALSHATLPGIGVAFIVAAALGAGGRSLPVLILGAALSGVAGVLFAQFIVSHSRLRQDVAIGVVLSVFFGLGVVLLSYIQTMDTGAAGGLHHFMLGQTAALKRSDAMLMGGVALFALVATGLLFKEFRVVCFDENFARAQDWPVARIDLLMMALVVVVTVVGLQAVGLLLIVAFVIIPPTAARFWTERLGAMTVLGAGFGGISGYLGASASALLPDLPTGGVIVLVAGAIFLISMFLAPRRGVLADIARRMRMRHAMARDHVLRSFFELFEAGPYKDWERTEVPRAALQQHRDWRPRALALTLRLMALRRLVSLRGGAFRITRLHRLWEQYLTTHADIAPSQVHGPAELVEHVLTADLVAELEAQLARAGRRPRPDAMPPSAHPLDGAAEAPAS
jgi:manganese/zinc/iron transport system permease protein